ncbi:MAG: hypothetical protein JKX85_02850 [Phycisphaeraceae bacterium]|nr:hypothetical protein [Phycisphaeraceae bacterium]
MPQVGPLTALTGTLPGPDGDYTLKLEKHENDWLLQLNLPSSRKVILDAAFSPDARTIEINGKTVHSENTHTMPNGVIVGRFIWEAQEHSEIKIPNS